MTYESRQDKNKDMTDTDFHGTSEDLSMSFDSSEEDSDNQSSSSTVYDSDYMDMREDLETKIEMDAMSSIKFHVVKFPEENSVTVVPCSWVEGDMCAWPSFKSLRKIEDCVKNLRDPEPSCQSIRALIMKSIKRKVLRMLESIQQDIKEIKESEMSSRGRIPSLSPGCPQLPCENPAHLVKLEGLLKDENMFCNVCDFLSSIGGNSIKDCTKRILSKLLSTNLSLKSNWKGTRAVKLVFATFSLINK
ncbi:hypothetical protein AVEN_202464-1 [Araneus ventricosus]|uniref:Uncharacterized protein n=1 Tax=Araneus ventricosus TaxID=182803 RepID=A0A4Y2VUL4_ARAVE|nr:hypothetical protein AVEN_202464-1 [Araneus ventricosus]